MSKTWDVELTGSDKLDKIGVRIGSYNPDIIEDLKSLPGPVRWSRASGMWTFPIDWDVCVGIRKIADKHKCGLDISDKLREWAVAEKTRVDSKPDVNSVALQELPILSEQYPATWTAISSRPFQTVGAKFAAINRTCLLADEPGLGKTLQTIAAVVEAGITGPILVVSLKSALDITWPEQIARWLPGDKVSVINGSVKPHDRREIVKFGVWYDHPQFDCESGKKRHWILAGPDYIRMRYKLDRNRNYVYKDGKKEIDFGRSTIPEMFDCQWSAIIVDESHRYLAGSSGNVKKQSAQRQGLGALLLKPDGLKIAISGTPFRGKQENAWGTLNWLMPGRYTSSWKWLEKHFEMHDDGYGSVLGDILDETKFYEELSSVMIRRTKAEVTPELPPKVYAGEPLDPNVEGSPVAVWLPMSAQQSRAYKQMVQDAASQLDGGDITANGVLAEITRLKQLACSYGRLQEDTFYPDFPSNKIDWLFDFFDDRAITDPDSDETGKVIVASQFTKLLNMLSAEMSNRDIPHHKLTGDTLSQERIRMAEEFQSPGGPRVFLLNTNAGGASITLDAADDVVMLDTVWNKDDQEQVEDRAHRVSRTDHTVTIWNVLSRGSIEEAIAAKTTAKQRNIKSLLDGQRGVAFASILIKYLTDGK